MSGVGEADDTPEWITVGELASRLGRSVRQARRYADTLPPEDVDTQERDVDGRRVRVRVVRWSDPLRGVAPAGEKQGVGGRTETDTASVSSPLIAAKDAHIADLQKQIASLQGQVASLQEAQRLREENLQALLQIESIQRAKPVEQLPASPGPGEEREPPLPQARWWKRLFKRA